jgi:hypothetical protein
MAITTKELWAQAGADITAGNAQIEQHPADTGYSPPVSNVKLPSRGLIYPSESPLYLVESLDIKAVTAKEENILSSPVLIKQGKVLTVLMKACITNRMIDPDQMLVGDRNAVLTAIRVSAYGPKYSASVTCPECGETADQDFDLSKLNLKTLDVEPTGGPGSNDFEFTLPASGRLVHFKLMDSNVVAKLDRDTEAVKKKTGQEQNVTMRLIAQVISMQGIDNVKDLSRALSDLPAKDSRALRLYMDSIAPGVDMSQEYECSSCGKQVEVEIPIGTEFFWPTE